MKTELKEISPTQKQIDIEIDADTVSAAYDRISDRYAKAANVPGFRPGHAPRGVVRTRFKDQIRTEVLRELLPTAVQQAVEEHKLEALGEPQLNLENTEGLDQLGQKSISFNVNVDVLPEIKLKNYKGLAGKKINYTVKVSAVRIKELPELDDEWAQSLGDEVESVDRLKQKIRSDLEAQAKNNAEGKVRTDLLRQLVETHDFELPERLVEHQTEHRFESVVRDMISQGIDPRNPQLDWEKARGSLKEQSTFELRSSLLLERIADEEKIEVTDQEIDDEINAIAHASRQSPDQVRAVLTKQGGERSIAPRLRNRKALDFLVANARVIDKEWKEETEESGARRQETE